MSPSRGFGEEAKAGHSLPLPSPHPHGACLLQPELLWLGASKIQMLTSTCATWIPSTMISHGERSFLAMHLDFLKNNSIKNVHSGIIMRKAAEEDLRTHPDLGPGRLRVHYTFGACNWASEWANTGENLETLTRNDNDPTREHYSLPQEGIKDLKCQLPYKKSSGSSQRHFTTFMNISNSPYPKLLGWTKVQPWSQGRVVKSWEN